MRAVGERRRGARSGEAYSCAAVRLRSLQGIGWLRLLRGRDSLLRGAFRKGTHAFACVGTLLLLLVLVLLLLLLLLLQGRRRRMVKKLSRYDAASPKEAKRLEQKPSLRRVAVAQEKKHVRKLREAVDGDDGEVRRRRGVRTQMRSIRRMLEHLEKSGVDVDPDKKRDMEQRLAELEKRAERKPPRSSSSPASPSPC